jgi:hypothetical protein
MDQPTTFVRRLIPSVGRRPRRGFTPAVRALEGRQLLTGSAAASATMTQTATFPDLEAHPTLSDQALLYFSATMGTLTEVDVVTSGSFQSTFSAENLGPSSSTITGTTTANLAINIPTGAVPVTIPSVTQTFNASAFDGALNDGGTSGKTFAPVTSSSAPQTMVLTSPADLAAFTGHFRIPLSVSGHATGSVVSSNGDVSSAFQTDTSATITVIYHYIPNLPSLDPPPSSPPASTDSGTSSPPASTDSGTSSPPTSTGSGTNAAPISPTGTDPGPSSVSPPAPQAVISLTHAGKRGLVRARKSSLHRHVPKPHELARRRPMQVDLARHHRPGSTIG